MTIHPFSRRRMLLGLLTFACCGSSRARAQTRPLPVEVAGVRFPDADVARMAGQFSYDASPGFLFNHCMRTYLFGAIGMERHALNYDANAAFAASALHDLGLLPKYATKT